MNCLIISVLAIISYEEISQNPSALSLKVDEDTSLYQMIIDAPCSSWSQADLGSTIQYLRGCKQLVMPEVLRASFPKEIGEWPDTVEHQMAI